MTSRSPYRLSPSARMGLLHQLCVLAIVVLMVSQSPAWWASPRSSSSSSSSLVLPAHAWGPIGHQTVGAIAQSLLTPTAAKYVTLWSAGYNYTVGNELANMSTWADNIKSFPEWAFASVLHYVNTPYMAGNYNQERDCPTWVCVDGAVQNYTQQLVNMTLTPYRRLVALRFVVHFIGDIGQPLHCGFTTDRGGNNVNVKFMGSSYNLHSVWDTQLIKKFMTDSFGGSQANMTAWFIQQVANLTDDVNLWSQCLQPSPQNANFLACSGEWLQGTASVVSSVVYYNGASIVGNGTALGLPYYNAVLPFVQRGIMQAGVRLANVLNNAFASFNQTAGSSSSSSSSSSPASPSTATPTSQPVIASSSSSSSSNFSSNFSSSSSLSSPTTTSISSAATAATSTSNSAITAGGDSTGSFIDSSSSSSSSSLTGDNGNGTDSTGGSAPAQQTKKGLSIVQLEVLVTMVLGGSIVLCIMLLVCYRRYSYRTYGEMRFPDPVVRSEMWANMANSCGCCASSRAYTGHTDVREELLRI